MMKMLKGEGWVELLFAMIAVSIFGVWGVSIASSRLNSPTLWEAWQAQHQRAPVERVAASVPAPAVVQAPDAFAAK